MKDAKSFTKFCKDEGEIKHWASNSFKQSLLMNAHGMFICLRQTKINLFAIHPPMPLNQLLKLTGALTLSSSQIVEIQNQRSTLPLNAS